MARVLLTGASGMLGRAIYDHLKNKSELPLDSVQGWASSRLHGGKFVKVDLEDSASIKAALAAFKVNCKNV